jgi:primary-amine oxidase
MSAAQVPVSLPFVGAKPETALQHPISPLTAGEITGSSRLVRQLWPENTKLQFKAVTLQEPNKAELLPYITAEYEGKATSPIDRKSFVVYYIRNTVSLLVQIRAETRIADTSPF